MNHQLLIARQRAYFQTGASRSQDFRRAQLKRLYTVIESRENNLFQALHDDLGKSPHAAFTTEIGIVLSDIRYALRHLKSWMTPERRRTPLFVWPSGGKVYPEPLGLALILGPWNYPFHLLLSPLVGAIAAGNCVVLKPSEIAPNTSAAIAALITDTFPTEYIAAVEGDSNAAKSLLREPFDTIFFTGSTTVGRAVMAAAAEHLTPVTLELGGKCPAIVCADAPLELAARRIAWGKFMNAGQTCVAPDYVLVDRSVREPFIQALQRAVLAFYGENPQLSPDYGRIINPSHFGRLVAYLSTGRIVHGGNHDAADLYISPTILTDIPSDSALLHDEIFGPLLPVCEFSTLSDALSAFRDRPTPLALYLFTRDRKTQQQILAQTRSGGVCINDTISHILGHALPFGGLGESGMGAYHGKASFDSFSHRRSVVDRSLRFDPSFRYPPVRTPLSTIKRVFRFLLGG